MEEILEENDRLKKEVERLTETLKDLSEGLSRSVEFRRQRYLEMLRQSLGITQGSHEY
jgi:hypothetical protein